MLSGWLRLWRWGDKGDRFYALSSALELGREDLLEEASRTLD